MVQVKNTRVYNNNNYYYYSQKIIIIIIVASKKSERSTLCNKLRFYYLLSQLISLEMGSQVCFMISTNVIELKEK